MNEKAEVNYVKMRQFLVYAALRKFSPVAQKFRKDIQVEIFFQVPFDNFYFSQVYIGQTERANLENILCVHSLKSLVSTSQLMSQVQDSPHVYSNNNLQQQQLIEEEQSSYQFIESSKQQQQIQQIHDKYAQKQQLQQKQFVQQDQPQNIFDMQNRENTLLQFAKYCRHSLKEEQIQFFENKQFWKDFSIYSIEVALQNDMGLETLHEAQQIYQLAVYEYPQRQENVQQQIQYNSANQDMINNTHNFYFMQKFTIKDYQDPKYKDVYYGFNSQFHNLNENGFTNSDVDYEMYQFFLDSRLQNAIHISSNQISLAYILFEGIVSQKIKQINLSNCENEYNNNSSSSSLIGKNQNKLMELFNQPSQKSNRSVIEEECQFYQQQEFTKQQQQQQQQQYQQIQIQQLEQQQYEYQAQEEEQKFSNDAIQFINNQSEVLNKINFPEAIYRALPIDERQYLRNNSLDENQEYFDQRNNSHDKYMNKKAEQGHQTKKYTQSSYYGNTCLTILKKKSNFERRKNNSNKRSEYFKLHAKKQQKPSKQKQQQQQKQQQKNYNGKF